MADIQLLGSKRQAELAREMAAEGRADPDPLLRLLRDDLRREMSLEALSGKPIHLRVSEEPPQLTPATFAQAVHLSGLCRDESHGDCGERQPGYGYFAVMARGTAGASAHPTLTTPERGQCRMRDPRLHRGLGSHGFG